MTGSNLKFTEKVLAYCLLGLCLFVNYISRMYVQLATFHLHVLKFELRHVLE